MLHIVKVLDMPPEFTSQTTNQLTESDNPRAFVTGAGFVLQGAGMIFMFGACGVWLFSAFFIEKADTPVDKWADYLNSSSSAAAYITLGLVTCLVGGIGLAAVGVGLQGEKPSSGYWAMGITGLMAGLFAVLSATLFLREGYWGIGLVAASLFVGSVGLFLLASYSAGILKKHPPPPDLNDFTDDLLEEYRVKRDERRKKFDM